MPERTLETFGNLLREKYKVLEQSAAGWWTDLLPILQLETFITSLSSLRIE